MRSLLLKTSVVLTVVASLSIAPAAQPAASQAASGTGPVFKSIGPLTFGPGWVAVRRRHAVGDDFCARAGCAGQGGATGAKAITGIDQQIAALLGTDVREIAVTDMAVHPKTRNAYLSVMRGQGATASPAPLARRRRGQDRVARPRQDEVLEGQISRMRRRPTTRTRRATPRTQSITDMAFVDGRLYVAGLSNEEFSSKLRSVAYPFSNADNGTSVEIYHGNHGAFETRSPVYTFVPHKMNGETNLIAGLSVHAARQVSGRQPASRARKSWVRRLRSSATETARSTWCCTRRTAPNTF